MKTDKNGTCCQDTRQTKSCLNFMEASIKCLKKTISLKIILVSLLLSFCKFECNPLLNCIRDGRLFITST